MREMNRLEKFGSYLHDIRMENGYTLSDIANKIELTKQYLSYLERGKKDPSDSTIYKIANFYNINEQILFNLLGRIPHKLQEKLYENEYFNELIIYITENPCILKSKQEEFCIEFKKLYERYSQ